MFMGYKKKWQELRLLLGEKNELVIELREEKGDLESINDALLEKNRKLEQELREAKDLKELLNQFHAQGLTYSAGMSDMSWKENQTQDMITGRTIFKDNGNKVIKIDRKGDVTYGLTEEKCDKGYKYKLIRK